MTIKGAKKLVADSYDKKRHVIHIRNLKQALNNGLVFLKVHRIIKYNQKTWLKPYEHKFTKKSKK